MVQSESSSSNVTSETSGLINYYLTSLEAQHDIEILLASENGSRAWGYSSENSDYDVKFIYRYKDPLRYKELYEPDQVIQFKSHCGNYDFNGWDIKKTLLLLRKGNAQCFEFAYSPVIYRRFDHQSTFFQGTLKTTSEQLRQFIRQKSAENFERVQRHYYALAKTTYFERVRDVGEPTLKKYFYILRPLLCVHFMENTKQLPLLEFEPLLDYARIDLKLEEVYDITKDLLALKRAGEIPTEVKKRIETLDVWLDKEIQFWSERFSDKTEREFLNIQPFNELYERIAYR